MKEKTCCVAGHRDLPAEAVEEIKAALESKVRQAISEGYTCFLTNFMEGAGLLFAEAVVEIQQDDPDIRLEAVLPYRGLREELLADETAGPLLLACSDAQFSGENITPDCHNANRKE